jgi:hypothetical protein
VKRLRGVIKRSAHPSDGVKAFLFGAPYWNF